MEGPQYCETPQLSGVPMNSPFCKSVFADCGYVPSGFWMEGHFEDFGILLSTPTAFVADDHPMPLG